nr:MAG TPA: Hint (Hedgehog/Intein) domain N-terminal region [Caudoviricetes sp.]
MEQTRSQRFIQEYARLMKSSAEFFNKDSVLMSREDYDNAKLRILVVFPSPASTKAVSMTAAVLNDYVISSCPGVFIDFAYVPEQDDLKFYDKANMPYAIGNVTHLDASHFDIVGFSISILFESISVAWIMNSFTRCDKPLPLTWSERKDKKLSDVPVFYAGGITCSVADILFGELGDGRQAFLDYLHLGEFHCSKLLFDHYLVSREKGRTVQEMIDSFWKEVDFNDWLYQPQAYQVEFNDKNQIVKNVKINPNAPDMCKPYYPDEMPKEMGAARGIVMGNGVNAGLGQILAANGCSRSGFCNFSVVGNTLLGTPDGLFPIESMVDKGPIQLQSTGLVTCKDILRQKDERAYRVYLESGVYLDCSAGHKWIRAIDHKKGNKEKTYTTRQVSNIVNKGGEFVVLRKIGNHFGVEWHSDLKIVNLREDSVLSSDEKCYQYSFGASYSECKEQVNDLVVRLNFYGFDTGVIKGLDLTTIEWWPMPNCATYDRVVSVEALNEIVPMYDVFDTDDHTVCYNGVITHQCYSEDTLVTTDKGLVRIADLEVGDKVDGGSGVFEEVTAKFDTGVQDVLKFTLDDGNELRVTFDHNLLDSEGKDKRAKDFKVGDFVYFKPHFCDSGINADGKMLYLAGYFLGDGSYEKHKYSTRSDCGVSGIRWYFSRTPQGVSNMKLVKSTLDDLSVQYTVEDNPKNTTVRIVSRDVAVIQQVLQIIGDKERLTAYTLSLDKDSFLWFMSGVIASDGTVDSEIGHIRLGMSRKELILDMYRKLQQFNMASKVDYYTYKQTASEHPRFSKYEGRVIKKWRILFSLKDNEKFADAQIAMFGEGKQEVKKARKVTTRKQVGKIVSIEVEEKVQCYNLTVEPNHKLMVQGNVCSSNCHEGAYTGGWVENTPERLVELAKLCRKHTASTTLKAYSFNSNYLSDYKRNIYDWLGVYPRVTFNNMRLEELGLDKDALKMMKLAGYQRMTAPLEGISERIRNNLLNKNLSEKALDSYLEYGMMMGAVDCKVGIVLTGYEEEQDWQAFYDFNMKWRKKCHDMGGNIPFRYKCTLLVHYPHTPVEFLERKAARHAFYGTYIMPNEWNEKYYADHIRIKLNGFKHSTFIEQAIVDLGRYATPWMYNYIIRPGYPFYNTKTIVTHEEAWEAFKGMINPDYFFNERKMDEYISICHRIHIAMHANVIFQAKKILKDGANATPTIRCLKTYEGCPVDCKAHVYEKSPLITFGDAWLDETGKLTGKVWEEVKGCQRCKTPADRKKVLARELPMSKNADDILMYKAPSLELRLRFRIQRKKEYEVLSPRNTAFVFFTKFLRKSEELCKVFWELDAYHNMFWQSEEDKTYVVSGQQIVDVTFTDRKAKELVENLIQEVNAEAKSFRVVSVREVPLTDKIKVDDYNVFYFESTLSAEFWQFSAMNYDGEVKVEGAQGAMETIKDVRLTAPSFTLRDKVKGYFTVPCKYSPWHYLQGLMAVRRISLSKLLATTSIQCITTVRESNGTCMCGKEKAVSDIGTNMQQKVGRDCLAAFLTSKL